MTGHARGVWTKRAKKVLKWLGIGLLVVLVVLVAIGFAVSEPRPRGTPGPEAEEMAHAIERAVNREAWEATGAVRWNFGGRHTHLWDKERGLSRVGWGDVVVLQRLDARVGVAFESGARVRDREREAELVEDAWERWCNDSFWLNPLVKLYDDGVTRSVVRRDDGTRGLLVSYASGGVTPGDAYLWIVGDDGLPRAWKMWVSVIPIGGVQASWDGWITLSTGAKVATRHEMGPITLELENVEGASTLAELEPGADPFAALVER